MQLPQYGSGVKHEATRRRRSRRTDISIVSPKEAMLGTVSVWTRTATGSRCRLCAWLHMNLAFVAHFCKASRAGEGKEGKLKSRAALGCAG